MGQFNLVFKKVENIPKPNIFSSIEVSAPKEQPDNIFDRQFIFVTGSAGSGKTHSIRERSLSDPSYIELGATTGIASINLDVKTINSILKYFDTDSLLESYIDQKLHWRLREIREEKRNIGIEEVSMMDARALDILFDAIHEINEDKNPKKLGLHLIGDLLQLPVISTKLKPAEIVTKAKCWPYFQQNTLRLTKIWRQDNPNFVNAINLVRSGDGKRAVELLKACGVNFIPKIIDKFDGTTLITKNDQVDDYNSKRLTEINSPIINSIPVRRGEQLSEWRNQIPSVMRFKIGAFVMILSNDTPDFNFVNGDGGTILDYNQKEDYFTIKLKRNDKEVKISRIMRKNLTRKQPEQRHFSNSFTPYVDSFTKKWVIGDILYHPLKLAWATSVHRSQGLSLDKVQVDATNQFFGFPGMSYVAISRCRTPENLYIVGNEFNLISKIKTNPDVRDYV